MRAFRALALASLCLGLAVAAIHCGYHLDGRDVSSLVGDLGPPPGTITKVSSGPEKSGGDIKLIWAIGTDGSRVKAGEEVYSQRLSGEYGSPVFCSFQLPDPRFEDLFCIPTFPTAIQDNGGQAIYNGSTCGDGDRVVAEIAPQRTCIGTPAVFVVFRSGDPMASCSTVFSVYKVAKLDAAPAKIYVKRTDGSCAESAVNPALLYYSLGRKLELSEIPSAKRGVE